jgi:hypothetical protein
MKATPMTKRCSECGVVKPRTEFYARRNRDVEDGTIPPVQARCKPCDLAHGKAWRAVNREKLREYWRRDRRKAWANPERRAVLMDKRREQLRRKAAAEGRKPRLRVLAPTTSNGPTLPSRPLAELFSAMGNPQEVARVTGLNDPHRKGDLERAAGG